MHRAEHLEMQVIVMDSERGWTELLNYLHPFPSGSMRLNEHSGNNVANTTHHNLRGW